jgi:hypothetical protein
MRVRVILKTVCPEHLELVCTFGEVGALVVSVGVFSRAKFYHTQEKEDSDCEVHVREHSAG